MTTSIIEGYGTYGIVYSSPRLPYSKKYNFDNSLVDDIMDDNFLYNEVSKVFFDVDYYKDEMINYCFILEKYILKDIYFNVPLHYGIIDYDYVKEYKNKYYFHENIFENYYYLNYEKVSKYQITFLKGYKINDLNFNDFILKIMNVVKAVKFLNDQNYLFNDLKIENLILIDNVIKICDYSSLRHIDDIDLDFFSSSILKTIFYYPYNPILNKLLYYYLFQNKYNRKLDMNILLNEIDEEYHDEKSYNYLKFNKKIIKKIDEIYNYEIEINSLKFYSKDIIKDIYFYFYKNSKKIRNNYYSIYLNKFIKYFDEKYINNYDKIKDIISRINIYSLGIIFIDYLKKNIDDDKKNKIIQIFIKCILQIFIINEEKLDLIIFENNIDEIINYLGSFIYTC